MATYNYTKITRTRDLHEHLLNSLGNHFQGIVASELADGTSMGGTITHDGVLTDVQIQGGVDTYTLDLRFVDGQRTKTGTTSGNTPQTVAPLALPANCVAKVAAEVVASSGASVARWEIKATAKRGTGNAAMVDTPIITKWDDTPLASATATIVVTGQSVAVQVTGINATNILWTGKISFEAVVS